MDINNETPSLVVFQKPELKDQVIAAAVGTIATVVVTVALSAAATGIQNGVSKFAEKRKLKKIQKDVPPTTED